ncbi:O-antigen ligase family protein [Methylocaldum gracile subsp. desertum]|uniref:O-antigen ligase family protein n=1 Tax=Methylocaldum sp. GT1BW TaxID=3438964 RepID=UPI003DA17806
MNALALRHQARLVSVKQLFLIVGILGCLTLGDGVVAGAHVMLGLWLLLGIPQTIQALSLAVVIKYLNPVLYTYPEGVGVMGWGVIVLGGIRLLFGTRIRNVKIILPLVGFSLVVAALFVVQDNKAPAVSVMKLIMFTYVSCAIVLGCASLSEEQARELGTWFNSLIAAVVLLSLPVFAFAEVAYARNGQGFQGILNHPQAFGPILAPAASALLASIFFGKPKNFLRFLAIVLGLIALIIVSQARTALAAVMLSMAATTAVVFFKKRKFMQFRMGRFIKISTLALVALMLAVASSSVLQEKLMGYVYKRGSTNIESALSSRSGGIESQWNYFLENPLTGCGFGVYPWGLGRLGAVEFMGLPISAPVEKGFLPTAILEETGLLGGISFLGVLIYLSRRVIAQRNTQWMAMFFACIFVNVGEMVIFSVGGVGLLYWLMIGVATRVPPDQGTENSEPQKNRSIAIRSHLRTDSATAMAGFTRSASSKDLRNEVRSQTGVSLL